MRAVLGLFMAIFGGLFQTAPPGEAQEILTQLSKIRLDKSHIHYIRDITIRRDVLTVALNRGAIAFLEPINGKVTGAVFIGSGEIVAIPPDPIEKEQVYKFTGTPVLNETFETAILRFTDNTYEEIRKEIADHASEDVTANDAAQFEPWDMAVAARATALNLRLLTDLLEPDGKTFFLGELNGNRRGWFDVVYDLRAIEEVSVFQVHDIGGTGVTDVWASFNQRSEARNPEAVAHEHKSPIDILSYEIDGGLSPDSKIDAKATMRVKGRTETARVLNFDLTPSLRVASLMTDTDSVPFYQSSTTNSLIAVLPDPLKRDQSLTLRFTYGGPATGQEYWYPTQHQQTIASVKSEIALRSNPPGTTLEYSGRTVAPASYHDQWLVEGLSRYLAAMFADASDPKGTQVQKLLKDARDELKPIESAGPIWLGRRLASTLTPSGYRAVYSKGVWIIHMIRMMLRQEGLNPDAKFLAMLEEFVESYRDKAASTWDFKSVVEKYASKKLDWFFDQWVFATGLPSYSTKHKIEASGNEFTIEGKIEQTGVSDDFTMPVPIFADGQYLGTVQVSDSEGQFKFRVSKKPELLTVDAEMTILTATSQ
jgi:Peptidase family M1 domain